MLEVGDRHTAKWLYDTGVFCSEDHVVSEDQEDDHRCELGGLAGGSGELRRGDGPKLLRRLGVPV